MFVWFASTPGDRHEDHVPYGIFSSLEQFETLMKNKISKEENKSYSFEKVYEDVWTWCTYVSVTLYQEITLYKVEVDVIDPEVLST